MMAGCREKVMMVSMAEEAGKTIRAAITQWPRTLRLISLLLAATSTRCADHASAHATAPLTTNTRQNFH